MHSEDLSVTLTDAEMKIVAEELGAMENEMAAIRESKRASAKHYGALIEDLQEKISVKAKIATEGREFRPVDCEWQPDFIAGLKRLIRLDTLAEVRSFVLSDEERQTGLFDQVVEATPETVDELGTLPDPETVVQEATADDPGDERDPHQDFADEMGADEQYDASHANGSGKGRKKKKAPETVSSAVN